jgi:uncharacterized protein YcbK (DUF882 family)
MTRRNFLTYAFAASLLGLAGKSALAAVPGRNRELWLQHVHTGEKLRIKYREDDQISDLAYGHLCHFLRDFYVNETTHMDVALLDLLYTIQTLLAGEGTRGPIMVLSAYRTKATNDRLKGTACKSMHLYGKAIDIHVPGIRTADLADIGHQLQRGGVGTYLNNGFVHFDTGRVRYWGENPATVDVRARVPLSARSGGTDPAAYFNPRDAKWKQVSRDQLDIMILKWRQKRHRVRVD